MTQTGDSATTTGALPEKRHGLRNSIAGGVGTFLEWFDYGLFGTASALYIGPLFFTGDPVAETLAAFATFAVGFAARPIGGAVLGYLGDRWGRKNVLVLTIAVMGVSTFLMGLLPTLEQIGVLAPILLVLLRLIQGFGAGAEFSGALIFASESSRENRQGLHLSFTPAASAFGPFVGAGLFAGMAAMLPPDAMMAWGWRIPFLISAAFAVVAIIMRARLEESDEYAAYRKQLAATAPSAQARKPKVPLREIFRADPRAFWASLLIPSAVGYSNYLVAVFGVSYMTNTLGLPSQLSLTTLLFMTGIGTITCIFAGHLADRFGAMRMIVVGALSAVMISVPFFLLLSTRVPALVVLGGVLGMVFIWSVITPACSLLQPRLFDVEYRYSGLAFTREIATVITGGSAPFVATYLVSVGGGEPWLVVVMSSFMVLLTMTGAALGMHRLAPKKEVADEADGAAELKVAAA